MPNLNWSLDLKKKKNTTIKKNLGTIGKNLNMKCTLNKIFESMLNFLCV